MRTKYSLRFVSLCCVRKRGRPNRNQGLNTFGEELAPVLTERYRKEHMAVTVFSIFLFKVLKVQNRV